MSSYTERVLVVLKPDGTFAGAQADRLIDGLRYETVPLSQQDLADVLPSGPLLAQINGTQAQLAQTASELSEAIVSRDDAMAAVAMLTQERDTALAERDTARAERDSAVSARDALQAKIDATKAKARLSVSPAQARLALKRAGRLAAVQDMIEALPADDDVRIVWDWAVTWERDSPFVDTLGAALGLTGEQIDDLFELAATL